MKIALDIDNILCNTTDCIIDYLNERIPNLSLTEDQITSYWIEESLPEEYRWVVPIAFEQKAVWKNVKMIDEAAHYIEKLWREGNEIYFATATTAENFRKKISFLCRDLSFFPSDYVKQNSISIKKKQLLDVDVLVDDCLDNLNGFHRYRSICLDYPWNRDTNDDNIIRVYNWEQIYKAINFSI